MVYKLYLNKAVKKKKKAGDFFGGSVVKYPPANAGDTGLIPDEGRSHMLWGNWARALEPELQLLSPHVAAAKALKPVLPNKKSHMRGSSIATIEQLSR